MRKYLVEKGSQHPNAGLLQQQQRALRKATLSTPTTAPAFSSFRFLPSSSVAFSFGSVCCCYSSGERGGGSARWTRDSNRRSPTRAASKQDGGPAIEEERLEEMVKLLQRLPPTASSNARHNSVTKSPPSPLLEETVKTEGPATKLDFGSVLQQLAMGSTRKRPREITEPANTQISQTSGFVYRTHRAPLLAHLRQRKRPAPPAKPSVPLLPNYLPLSLDAIPYEVVEPLVKANPPRLEHGLRQVLFNKGVHPVRDFYTKRYLFPSHLAKIHQPEEIDFSVMPPFYPPSKDPQLTQLAQKSGALFQCSTSSMTHTLAQFYFLFSKFKPVDLSSLSYYFQRKPNTFTKSLCKAVSLFFIRKNGVYAVDNDPGNITDPPNRILMDLGKSLENVFTMPKDAFEKRFLKARTAIEKPPPADIESFHFLKMGNVLCRSQLDCYDPDLPSSSKTFDLKTRATFPVRLNMRNYKEFTNYRLTQPNGAMYSYEKEFYDMCRSAMLKYCFQTRLGLMDGIFVAYHNTIENFGFEYINRTEMERILFGNAHFASTSFTLAAKLWDAVFTKLVQQYPEHDVLKISLATNQPKAMQMDLFVEPVSIQPNSMTHSAPFSSSSSTDQVFWWQLRLATYVNNNVVSPWMGPQFTEDDHISVQYSLTEVTNVSDKELLANYATMQMRTWLYQDEEAGEDEDEEEEGAEDAADV